MINEDSERLRKTTIAFLRDYADKGYENAVECIDWLEKQCELVDSLSKGLDNAHERIDGLIQKNNELCIKLENQCEQKHKSNIVPIFKVGDIIKNKKNGDTVKVEQILEDSYCYSGWDGAATIHSDFLISEQGNWELVKQNPAKQPHSYELEKEIEEWIGCEAFPEGTDISPLPKAMEIVRKTANHFYDFGRKLQSIRNIQCSNFQQITPENYINEGQKKSIQIVSVKPTKAIQ